ncbi:hypothetical protein ACO2Q9_02700 [Variovorax sp. VNK109]|uniref:hypothetical protein n=1 Tax=Variovorax sp. VNK109 TaxID=3400919 RepID=UPI003C11FC72
MKQHRVPSLQWIGAVFGILGAALLAMQIPPALGFGCFLVSNVAWLLFAAHNLLRGLFWQQVFFAITSLVGLWNWWLGPLLLGGAAS